MFISILVTLPCICIPSCSHPRTGYNNAQEVYCNWRSASPCGNLNVCCAAFQRQTGRPDQDHISQIADRRSKRIKRQPASQRSSRVPFPFVCCFGLFLAGLPHSCPCLDKSSVQPRSSSCSTLYQSLSLSSSLCLCRTLHNCRLLIDRSNNVMDAQPAFDATTRGNPRCSSTRMYMYVRVSRHGY